MRTCLRAALVAAAMLSTIAFSTPASAGMVPTPEPRDGAERELALEGIRARAAEWGVPVAGKSLERLETRELVALAESCEAMRAAGYHAQLIVGIILVLAGCCCGVWLIVDSVGEHHHHH